MSDLVLCFLSKRTHQPGNWIFVYRDGRVEKRGRVTGETFWQRLRLSFFLSDDPNESVLSHGEVSPARVEEACDLARRVLGYAKPTIHHDAHDPTQELALEVRGAAAWRKGGFTWGRASGNDAPLAPVVGDAEVGEFEVLMRLLWDMQVASIGGRSHV